MKTNTKTQQKLLGLVLFGLILITSFTFTPAKAGMMDEPVVTMVTLDKFEVTNATNNPLVWELDAWVLQDIQRLVFKSSGETVKGETASKNMLLYGHGIAPYWDVQVGLGYDTHAEDSHNWGVIGLSGMAPYFFETDAYALVDSDGTVGLRLASEYETLFTQRLILSSEIEAEAYSDDIPKLKLGSGLSSIGLGLRLRYEIKREFAPYIGVEFHKTYGKTADYHEEDFESVIMAGLRFWF
jgi:copper resistance protein B